MLNTKTWTFIAFTALINFSAVLYAYYASIFDKNIDGLMAIFYIYDISIIIFVSTAFCISKGIHTHVNEQLTYFSRPVFGLIFLILLLISSYDRFGLILSGVSRELLVFELPSNRVFQIISASSILYASILASHKRFTVITFLFIFLILGLNVAHTLSRTPFLLFGFFYVTASWINGKSTAIIKLMIFAIVIMLLGSLLTILQGRSDLFQNAIYDIPSLLIRYRSFTFQLHDRYMDYFSLSPDNFLFPEFGFFYEKFSSIFGPLRTPISVDGSTFVYDKVQLGPSRRTNANVNYSWITAYYARDAEFSLITKNVFAGLSLYLFLRLRLGVLYIYWLSYYAFMSTTRHPLLNIDSAYSLIGVAIFATSVAHICKTRSKNIL